MGPVNELQEDFSIKVFTQIFNNAGANLRNEISLVDSEGSSLECNYIEVYPVEMDNNSQVADIILEVSSYGTGGNDKTLVTASLPGAITSSRGAIEIKSARVFLPDTARTSLVNVICSNANFLSLAITYGVAVPYNPMRSKDRPTGS